jgi:hypothetical protein
LYRPAKKRVKRIADFVMAGFGDWQRQSCHLKIKQQRAINILVYPHRRNQTSKNQTSAIKRIAAFAMAGFCHWQRQSCHLKIKQQRAINILV